MAEEWVARCLFALGSPGGAGTARMKNERCSSFATMICFGTGAAMLQMKRASQDGCAPIPKSGPAWGIEKKQMSWAGQSGTSHRGQARMSCRKGRREQESETRSSRFIGLLVPRLGHELPR